MSPIEVRKELVRASVWNDNELQFARLICELVANVSNLEFEATCESMDLQADELQSLYDRANEVWERAKVEITDGSITAKL